MTLIAAAPLGAGAILKQFLLLASFATMILLETDYASDVPSNKCCFSRYSSRIVKHQFRILRNKYEELEEKLTCPHLTSAQWNLNDLAACETLEAVRMEVRLTIHMLQNQSEPIMLQTLRFVLATLRSLRRDIKICQCTPLPTHEGSGHFQNFKEQFQKFNSSNTEDSPQCLELAVGLNVFRLLNEDVNLLVKKQQHCHPS
ncbi:interferon lambda-2-like [Hemicordylus capensis]|uniref:interferon lambda-2-like n=1 Tax=Hemicordylus capensis TaxID=884348 RepID=UPI0023041C30|nr:interferon lambda-2-like [Hemicordylus capensis]